MAIRFLAVKYRGVLSRIPIGDVDLKITSGESPVYQDQETTEVGHVLHDPAFFYFLPRIDEEFAAVTRLGRCPGCEGPLHVADYPRKPRGCPAAVREDYSWRLSFTCGRCDGSRGGAG